MAYYVKYNWLRRASNRLIKRRKSLSHWPMFIYVHICGSDHWQKLVCIGIQLESILEQEGIHTRTHTYMCTHAHLVQTQPWMKRLIVQANEGGWEVLHAWVRA